MTHSVLTYLDQYCERSGHADLIAEPLNAVTNLLFILAGCLALRGILALPKLPMRARADLWLLTLALFCIGIGSGLWHTIPRQETMLMDVLPITVFINIYIIASLRRLLGLSWNKVTFLWMLYFGASIAAQHFLPPSLLNGTIMYIPTFVTLVLITVAICLRDREVGRVFVGAVLVWSLSLICRTVDMQVCSHLSIGTHFLWHMLNAWVLWRLMQVLIAKTR